MQMASGPSRTLCNHDKDDEPQNTAMPNITATSQG
jgi:hypothetical protein